MSRTIRWAKDTQKEKLHYFNDRFCWGWKYVKAGGKWKVVELTAEEQVKESTLLRRDGTFSRNGKDFYKWKRNKERRAFELQELKRIEHGIKDHFDDIFEKDREWID